MNVNEVHLTKYKRNCKLPIHIICSLTDQLCMISSDCPPIMMLLVGQVALLFVTTSVVVTTADDDNTGTLEDVANGWGEDYAWTPDLATALDQAQQQWK